MNSVDDSAAVERTPEAPPSGRFARVVAARRRLPENVRMLSWVSLANDSASELAYPIVPLFVTITLAAPVYLVGVIEGIAEALALIIKFFSGWLSDKQGGRRKPWIWSGYGLASVARAIVAGAQAWGWVLVGRIVDRVGKGARSSPRDALIRDSTPQPLMGAAFGYHRAMDTIGAVIGPLIAAGLLALNVSLREILWFAVIPGALTLLLIRKVREAPAESPHAAKPSVVTAERVSALPASFWTVLAIWVVFSLGNSSDVFLVLRSHNLGLDAVLVVLAYAVYNVVSATLAWPLGHLSDRIPRTWIIGLGTVSFGLVYLGFAFASNTWAVWPLFALYGVFVAATEGVGRAWVADHVNTGSVGTAYGVFYAATGGAALLASLAAGVLWTYYSPKAPFVLGASTAAAATVLLGLYAVNVGFGPRIAKALLVAIVVGLAVVAGLEHRNLGVFASQNPQFELPVVLTRPCIAPPTARVTPKLLPKFPAPDGVAYTVEEQTGPTHVVDGFLPTGIDKAHDAYYKGLSRDGYAIQRDEVQVTDAELYFTQGTVTGEVRLLQECRNRTYVQISTFRG
ncbi:MAG TPA: MFS transporter [Gaiellaceae bacterium]